MTALSDNAQVKILDSFEATKRLEDLTVLDTDIIYHGSLVGLNTTTGEVAAATEAATTRVIGVNVGPKVDNTLDGEVLEAKNVYRGICGPFVNGDSIAAVDIGQVVYLTDDQTVAQAAGANSVIVGIIHDVNSDGVWVDLSRHSV